MQKYSMSFTTGTLFHHESVLMADLYLKLGDWAAVRETLIKDNLIQSRTTNTLMRVCSEVSSRLRTLGSQELGLLINGTFQEQNWLLWLAVCRRYRFIGDFAVEVLRERFITHKVSLNLDDFEAFYNRKSEWHPEIEAIRPATRTKLRQVLFTMLRQVGLLASDNTINIAILSPRFLDAVVAENARDIMFFPAFESDIRRWVR